MKLKTLLAALALTVSPVIATAACFDSHADATMSCAEGSQWDAEAKTCVPKTTS